MIQCDSPTCKSLDRTETEFPPKRRHKNYLLAPPYGWFRSTTYCQGPGPTVTVTACSLGCLHNATVHAIEEAVRAERGG